jgi:hypothetical protein
MGVSTVQYIRKPLYVDAVRVTSKNFDEIAEWCQGQVLEDNEADKESAKKYIRVRVHNPINPRQTRAYVGTGSSTRRRVTRSTRTRPSGLRSTKRPRKRSSRGCRSTIWWPSSEQESWGFSRSQGRTDSREGGVVP